MNTKESILFLIFNRPEKTSSVFEAIRDYRPSRLYVAADGPRDENAQDVEKILKTREVIKIDWPCELHIRYRDTNLGCGAAVSDAIQWFFEAEDRGIILEDDCLPGPSFFKFCEELLEKYKDDTRIGQISGYNVLPSDGEYSYYFGTGGSIWGWATWRRVAQRFKDFKDINPMDLFDPIYNFTDDYFATLYLINKLNSVNKMEIDTWDYHWGCMLKSYNQLSIVPFKSLVVNIGFDSEGTHCTKIINPNGIESPANINLISHPSFISPNKEISKLVATTQSKIINSYRKILRMYRK